MTVNTNHKIWNSDRAVQIYATEDQLQKPERTIMNLLSPELPAYHMLDIGVGGGRTTLHFAPVVKKYLGIDYAENMVEACQERFPDLSFQVGDVRALTALASDSFDCILFSFNGIDYVSHADRLKALKEIRRVGKNGGAFIFSTHNLGSISRLYRLHFYKSPKRMIYEIARLLLTYYFNGFRGPYRKKPHAVLNDGDRHFTLRTYYIQPSVQVEQLEKLGFKNIRLFGLDGTEVTDYSQLNEDSWVYYLCHI